MKYFYTRIILLLLLSVFVFTSQSQASNEIKKDGRFIAFDNGTVLDTKTNLLWAAKDNGKNINWTDAKFYCENYNGGGYNDWRMPTKDELLGIYNSLIWNDGHHITKLITLTESFLWASDVKGSEAVSVGFDYDHASWLWSSITHKSRGRTLPVRFVK
jgi:hypothetical protein